MRSCGSGLACRRGCSSWETGSSSRSCGARARSRRRAVSRAAVVGCARQRAALRAARRGGCVRPCVRRGARMTGTAVPRRFALAAVAAGVTVGAAYTLSPLTVWFAITAVVLVSWCVRGLEGDERRWILGLLLLGIGLRIVAIAGLFASTDHWQVAFGSFFGDEEYCIRRSVWLRNVA